MVTAEDVVSALICVEFDFCEFFVLFENDAVCVTGTLLVFVDINFVVKCMSFVSRHEINRFFMVAREPTSLISLLIKLIITHQMFFRKFNELNKIRKLSFKPHIHISRQNTVVSHSIRLKPIGRFLQRYSL